MRRVKVDFTEDLLTDKGVCSVSPNCFISHQSSVSSTLYASKQEQCCLVLPGYMAKYMISKIIKDEKFSFISNCANLKILIVRTKIA